MDHPDLRPSLGKIIQGPPSTSTRGTKAHGVKVMEPGEDTAWIDEDTGEVVSIRQIPTAMETLRTELEAGVSTAGKLNTVATTAPASPAGYPEGAFWTRIDLATGDPVERERWVLREGAWEPIGLDASTIVTGKLDAGLIDTVSLAARLITAGLIRTGSTGQRLEMTSDGLVLWLLDDDGEQYEGVRIGPTGATLITVGGVTITPAAVTAPAGAFQDLAIAGQPAAEYVASRIWEAAPRMVTIGGAGQSSGNIDVDANVETGIFDVLIPNVQPSHWYRAEIELLTYPGGADSEVTVNLRHSPLDQGVMTNSPLVAGKRVGPVSGSRWDHRHVVFWFRGSQLSLVGAGGTARLLLSVVGTAKLAVTPDTTMAVYTEGRSVPFSSTLNRGGAPLPGGTAATAAPASTSVQSYSKEHASLSSTTYYTSTNAVERENGEVIQGSYDGTSGRRRHGSWWFPSMTGDLAGATITGVSIMVNNTHTYSGSGTAFFYAHGGGTGAGAHLVNVPFSKAQGRTWFDLPAAFWDGLKNGTIKGFMAYTTSTNPLDYLRFAGGPGSAAIKISYTK